jgi:ubiquinone/menaquinone biosynthesis C-methylase UbiE
MRRAVGPSYNRVMTTSPETFQLSLEAAELYESAFVPALFAEWAPHLVDIAEVGAGDAVLDVACGTGIVARTAADRVGATGRVAGLDLNEAMLTIAGRLRPDIDWRHGDAGSLPFPDRSFDAVTCSFGLMFFPDRKAALGEMARVAAADGTVALVVPASLVDQPAYGPFVDAAACHAGPEAVSLLGTYWSCGDLDELQGLLGQAALHLVGRRTRTGTVRFRSPEDFVATEVDGTPLRQRMSDEVYEQIREEARSVLAPYTAPDGSVAAPIVCHLVAVRPTGA